MRKVQFIVSLFMNGTGSIYTLQKQLQLLATLRSLREFNVVMIIDREGDSFSSVMINCVLNIMDDVAVMLFITVQEEMPRFRKIRLKL